MAPDDLALMAAHLVRVDLPLRRQLEGRSKPIEHVYFPESGFASVVADSASERGIEVGLIGREGMTGLAIVMGTDRTPHHTFMQHAGVGVRISVGDLQEVMKRREKIRSHFLLYGHAFVIQTTYTAMANGRSKIEERLARWLLMAQDRLDGDVVTLTHEFLSQMLGVRRAGVTLALNLLERAGLVRTSRGTIFIVDRRGLEKLSNGAYGKAEAEFNRLLG
jgi:CRP-like cAMP-binding protein